MRLETPGKRQSKALESIFFALPHKPIKEKSLSSSQRSIKRPVVMPPNDASAESGDEFSDDGDSTSREMDISDTEEEDNEEQ